MHAILKIVSVCGCGCICVMWIVVMHTNPTQHRIIFAKIQYSVHILHSVLIKLFSITLKVL